MQSILSYLADNEARFVDELCAYASIPGVSGLLRLGPNHNIVRQLSWATISDGLITTAP